MLFGDAPQELGRDVRVHQAGQNTRTQQAGRGQSAEAAPAYEPFGLAAGVCGPEFVVPIAAKESEGGCEGAGADAGDEVERRTISRSLQPVRTPAPYAPSAPPPEMARIVGA